MGYVSIVKHHHAKNLARVSIFLREKIKTIDSRTPQTDILNMAFKKNSNSKLESALVCDVYAAIFIFLFTTTISFKTHLFIVLATGSICVHCFYLYNYQISIHSFIIAAWKHHITYQHEINVIANPGTVDSWAWLNDDKSLSWATGEFLFNTPVFASPRRGCIVLRL